jgi:hypothetical protein
MSWYDNFKHCMHSNYGVTVPESLAGVYADAAAAAVAIAGAAKVIESLGSGTTVAELVGAGTAAELAEFLVPLVASFGAGALVGALLACGVIDQLL